MQMPNQPDISKYCDQMQEIKLRISAIDFLIDGSGGALSQRVTIESVYPQFRKILELIAMASLVANKASIEKIHHGIENFWNADLILKDLGKINPYFYPKPVQVKPHAEPHIKGEFVDREMDYLTRDEFVRLYKICGKVMHADNPLGQKANYAALQSQISKWRQKLVNLLNNHTIRLVGDVNLYVINMQEDRDEKVHGYTFAPTSPQKM
jgi:hypothetical protein